MTTAMLPCRIQIGGKSKNTTPVVTTKAAYFSIPRTHRRRNKDGTYTVLVKGVKGTSWWHPVTWNA